MANLAQIRAGMAQDRLKVVSKGSDATEAEIIVYATIGDSFWDPGVSAKIFSDELDKLPASVKNITVRLNSPGGDVFDGMTIYNRLRQHKAKVKVIVDGMAASIASIIMLAGDEVIMSEGSMVMIHKPWTGRYGNSDDFDYTAQLLLQLEEQMLGIYVRRSNLDKEALRAMLKAETWFDAKKAKEYGFANEIMEESLGIAASALEKPWITRAPKDIAKASDLAKAEAKVLVGKINSLLKK